MTTLEVALLVLLIGVIAINFIVDQLADERCQSCRDRRAFVRRYQHHLITFNVDPQGSASARALN